MWPGLVGKGGPDAEPPIDLDTMLDLTADGDGRRRQVRRRRPVPVRSARQHRLDRRRPEAAGRQDRARKASSSARSSRRSGRRPAAARRWASDEERKQFLDAGAQGAADRPGSCASSASASTASSASTRRRARRDWAEGSRRATRRRSPRRSGRPATSPRTTASGSPPKARSAGAACTAGSGTSSCSRWSDRPKTLGFQADMAHTLLFTLGYNAPEDRHPARGLRLDGSRRRSTRR